jgi:hypothetical protein
MAFLPKSDYRQEQTQHVLLQDSLTFKVGDVVGLQGTGATTYKNVLSNHATYTVGAVYPVGVLVGFCKENGEVIGQGQDPANTPNQLTTGATNVSTVKYHGVFLPITSEMEWVADLDAAAGTTNYSDQYGSYFELLDCRTLDESEVEAASAVEADSQVLSLGVNPLKSTQIFCKIIKNMYNRGYTG